MLFSQSPVTEFMAVLDTVASEHGWPAVIKTGLPRDVLSVCAKGFGVTEKALVSAFGLKTPTKKAVCLDADSSEKLLRVALTAYTLSKEKGYTNDRCWKWLTQPCLALRGRVPANLVCSSIGTEYVLTAASRL